MDIPSSAASGLRRSKTEINMPKPFVLSEERSQLPFDRIIISERQERTSFSSIKENTSAGIAQSFTNSKISSFSRLGVSLSTEEAIEDDDDELDDTNVLQHSHSFRQRAKMLMPSFIRGEDFDNIRGWKDIPNNGKPHSQSFNDLESTRDSFELCVSQKKDGNAANISAFESLPVEILTNMIIHLALDIPPENYAPRNADLVSLLSTSSILYAATLPILYRSITIPHSTIYSKFLRQLSSPSSLHLAQMVRRLDFSHFNPTQSGLTARQRREAKNLTKENLLQGLDLTENLHEFLGQEHIDDDLSAPVLLKLLTGLPRLQALDLCACSSVSFRDAFTSVVKSQLPEVLSIRRLSLHECTILPSIVFEQILPRLENLTHLDVSHTRITDIALMSIPNTARITHLNLSKCAGLTGDAVAKFLTSHPAIVGNKSRHHAGLVYLNLRSDAKTHSLLSSSNLLTILPALPSTLRSLNLSGSKMFSESTDNIHVTALLPLTKHLEELSVGKHVSLASINQVFSTSQISTCTLRYLDISDLGFREDVSVGALLDKNNCYLLRPWSLPLEVVEISEKVSQMCRVRLVGLEKEGWTMTEAGRRYWLVRDMRGLAGKTVPVPMSTEMEVKKVDEGERKWKMGAKYWGMRKIPVARMEVGGMYGLYMFKR